MLEEVLTKYNLDLVGFVSFWNLAIISVTLMIIYWWRKPHSKFPPGPRGVPLLGVVPFFGESVGQTLKKWSLKYGPVMSVRFGREDAVILNTVEAINQAFVKQSSSFSDRPRIELFYQNTGNLGILFRRYDETCKTQKHFAIKYLRGKGLASHKIDEVTNDEGDRFVEFLKTINRDPVNLLEYFYWLTSNVIMQIAYGKRYEYGDKSFLRLLDALEKLFNDPKDAKTIQFVILFTILGKIPPGKGAFDRFGEKQKYILETMETYIEDHRKNFDENNIVDFIDAFIYEQKSNNKNDIYSSNEQLMALCRDLLMAGTETVSMSIAWLFVFLLNNPDYEKKIRKEIDDAFGDSGMPTMDKKDELPITCAFIQETMRVKTLVPLSAGHMTSHTTKFMGHVIPKGTTVWSNLEGAHMDPVDWPNPKLFDPQRHIDENGKFVASGKVIPFGVGTRFCLGESLARAEMFIFFVKLLQKFNIRFADGVKQGVDDHIYGMFLIPVSCNVMLQNRG